MRNRRKFSLIWFIISCLAVTFGLISIDISNLMEEQNAITQDLSEIEYLSSSTQRGLLV